MNLPLLVIHFFSGFMTRNVVMHVLVIYLFPVFMVLNMVLPVTVQDLKKTISQISFCNTRKDTAYKGGLANFRKMMVKRIYRWNHAISFRAPSYFLLDWDYLAIYISCRLGQTFRISFLQVKHAQNSISIVPNFLFEKLHSFYLS